ncbi:MAG TPA: peptide ABC transporter substrate-binding protein [Candidatus Methylacidiphilales bacterium]|nr:peptide ABC transporter substrate-binding protein [Candidatus Methylacidiphilales bacterium]
MATAVLFLSGCGAAFEKADFTFINGAEPQTIDPALLVGQPDGRIVHSTFEGLACRSADGIIQPGVAERWDISPDGRVYTFHLRDSTWSNGDPVTATDFVRGWRRVIEPETSAAYAELLFFIAGAKDYLTAAAKDKLKDPVQEQARRDELFKKVGVRVVDDKTLEVRLSQPTPFFPQLCVNPCYMPIHGPTLEKYGNRWTRPGNIVSNGAYILADWRLQDRFVLKQNPRYWRKPGPAFKTVHALSVKDAATAFNLFYAGKADLLLDKGLVPAQIIPQISKEPWFNSNPFLATYFYRFNVTRKPLDDVRVRLALSMAVDKNAIVSHITRAGEPAAGSLTPPGMQGYKPPAGLPFNIAEAKRLLAEAGFPDGANFPDLKLLYNDSDMNEAVATGIQAMWKQNLNISIELRKQDWKSYLDSLNKLNYDIARSSWVGDYQDPTTFLDMFVTGGGNNRTGYSSKEFDTLQAQAAAEPDPVKRAELLYKSEVVLVEKDVPILPLYFIVGIALYHKDKLGGFAPNVVDEHPIRHMYFKDKAGEKKVELSTP